LNGQDHHQQQQQQQKQQQQKQRQQQQQQQQQQQHGKGDHSDLTILITSSLYAVLFRSLLSE